MTEPVGACVIDEVELECSASLPELPPRFSTGSTRPREVVNDWYRRENQAVIGSCNGCAWAGLLERIAYACRRELVQISKLWMYLAAQRQGGLLGSDCGSRPTDGGKVALTIGAPLETIVPYDGSHYPTRSEREAILSPENDAAGAPYKVKALWKKPQSHADTLDLIGCSGGGWVFGITWYKGLIPPDRIVRNFDPRGKRVLGAHAMNVLGYAANENLRAHNSHNDPPYFITPKAWEQMLSHPGTSVVGATGTADAKPIDWTRTSLWR